MEDAQSQSPESINGLSVVEDQNVDSLETTCPISLETETTSGMDEVLSLQFSVHENDDESVTSATKEEDKKEKRGLPWPWIRTIALYLFALIFGFSMFGVLIYVVGILNAGKLKSHSSPSKLSINTIGHSPNSR